MLYRVTVLCLLLQYCTSYQVVSWGLNQFGQFADGTTTNRPKPTVSTINNVLPQGLIVSQVGAGGYFSYALTNNGTLFEFGANDYGQAGIGFKSSAVTTATATNTSGVLNGVNITSVACGVMHTVVSDSAGSVYNWGSNGFLQLGDDSVTDHYLPIKVDIYGEKIASVYAGRFYTLALTRSGKIYGWGDNTSGQLGDGTTVQYRGRPVMVNTTGVLKGVTIGSVSVNFCSLHSVVVSTSGFVYAWGDNANGQLGDGTNISRIAPVAVNSSALQGVTITSASTGCYFTLAVSNAGKLYAWGSNEKGSLGDGTTIDRYLPTAVDTTGILNGVFITACSAGGDFSLALSSSGAIYAFGGNQFGQLGDGTTIQRNTPVAVDMSGALSETKVLSFSAGSIHAIVLSTSPNVTATPTPTPTPTSTLSPTSTPPSSPTPTPSTNNIGVTSKSMITMAFVLSILLL
jgi:alpha-tubulin suppressor-like RCC1 family protein